MFVGRRSKRRRPEFAGGARQPVRTKGFLAPTYEMIGSYEFRKGCGGAPIAKAEGAIDVPGPATVRLGEAARAANAWVVIGVIGRDRGTLYCTLLHPPDPGPDGSSRRTNPVSRYRVFHPSPTNRTASSLLSDDSGLLTSTRTGKLQVAKPKPGDDSLGADRVRAIVCHEPPCITRAAEPPAGQFGTLAWPAHSRRESRHLPGRRRPAPGFPDHWAGCRTKTI